MPSIVAKIIGDATDFDRTVGKTEKKISGFKKAIGTIGLTFGLASVAGWFNNLIKAGSHLTDVADKLGVTTEFMQTFSYAAQENGVNVTTAEMALQRFTRRLGEAAQGKGELLPILDQYNVKIKDTAGRTRSAEEVMKDLANVIKATPDSTERLRIAFKAFDSEGAALVTLMQQGSVEMDRLASEARDLGLVMSDDTARRMDHLSDSIARFNTKLRTNGTEALGGFIKLMEGAGTKWAELFMGTEEGRINDAFREMAKRALEVDETMEKVRRGRREYIKDGERLIPINKAIAEKAKELREHEAALNKEMKEKVAAAQKAAAQKQVEATSAMQLEDTNRKITEFISTAADILANKTLPAQERLVLINERIGMLTATANDQTLTEGERMGAAKDLVRLLGQQQTLVQGIAKAAEKALADDKKKTAELQKQKAALYDQHAALQAQLETQKLQYQQFEDNRFSATFEDLLSGTGGSARQNQAQDIEDLREVVRYQAAAGFNEDNQARTRARLDAAEANFTTQTGIEAYQNPYKDALKETEDQLKTMNKTLETL